MSSPVPALQLATLADRLRVARALLNLSQRGLAAALGIDKNTVNDWELGKTKNPDPEKIRLFAGWLRLPLEALTTGVGFLSIGAAADSGRAGATLTPAERLYVIGGELIGIARSLPEPPKEGEP